MTRRINWERNTLARKASHGLSIKDELEFIENDLASRWLQQAEAESAVRRSPAHYAPATARSSGEPIGKNRKKQNFAELDPHDARDQLEGVDMSGPPW